jgi:hypothetical protein
MVNWWVLLRFTLALAREFIYYNNQTGAVGWTFQNLLCCCCCCGYYYWQPPKQMIAS